MNLHATELPSSLRADYSALLLSLASVTPMRGESAVQATVRKMSNEEAESVAERIVTLFGQVARLSGPRALDDPAPVAGESVDFEPTAEGADVLPLFAAKA